MEILNRLFRKKQPAEVLPQDEPIVYPIGYYREDDLIIIEPDYTARWIKQFGDSRVAVTKMLAFLKGQYPEVTRFQIRK